MPVALPAGTAILWDIDGTLLQSTGSGKRAMARALEIVTGLEFPATPVDMRGRTDPDIAALVLAAHGIDDDGVVAEMLAAMEAVWEELEHEFRAVTTTKPGIAAALPLLQGAGAIQTIVTGNLQSIARRKVIAAGLETHLNFDLGGYGSDHRLRAELVRLCRARLADGGHVVEAEQTWVIGDTPRDLACARDNDVRCILVATGTYTYDELGDLGADAVFEDLADTDALVKLIASG